MPLQDDIEDKAQAWVTGLATLALLVLTGWLLHIDRLHGEWVVIPVLAAFGLLQLGVLAFHRLTR